MQLSSCSWSRRSLATLAIACSCATTPVEIPSPEGEDPLRWEADVRALEESGAGSEHPLVFVGSSSIRLWSTLSSDMAPLPVLNRGFGGSRIFDTIFWFDELVAVHEPRMIVVFAGTNDLSGKDPREPHWIAERFEELVQVARDRCPGVPLVYIAISPTPSREEHLHLVLETNRLIAEACARDSNLTFVDTASGLLDEMGRPDPRWFVSDRLHLNADGYAEWTRVLKPALEQALTPHH